MVQVNSYENQVDDNEDRWWKAETKDIWKVKWIELNDQLNIGVNEAFRTKSISKTPGLCD